MATVHMNPYLLFPGNCKEAIEFYHSCFGGELNIQLNKDSPMAASLPQEELSLVMHSSIRSDDILLMAADGRDKSINPNESISLCVSGSDREKVREYYEKLSKGATITRPLKEEFFGLYGEIIDVFGIRWMFQADEHDS